MQESMPNHAPLARAGPEAVGGGVWGGVGCAYTAEGVKHWDQWKLPPVPQILWYEVEYLLRARCCVKHFICINLFNS